MYELSRVQTPKLVAEILDGVREHVIKRCEEEAKKGATFYFIYLREGSHFIKEDLLVECIKLAKEFENNGYKVSIENSGNGCYVNFVMSFSWNGEVVKVTRRGFGKNEFLYDSDNGVFKEN